MIIVCPCIHCYSFEADDDPIKLVGVSTHMPSLQAKFELPFDNDLDIVGTYGLEIESDPPILSMQPTSRRASLTNRPRSPRKFLAKDNSTLIAMQFACAYSDNDEDNDTYFLLVVHADVFSGRRYNTEDELIPWTEWRQAARLTLDGLATQTATDQRNVFSCNVSADRVVVIDRQESTASVRVLDFNRIRFRNTVPPRASLANADKEGLQGSKFMRVVTSEPYDSRGSLELASRADGRGVGLPFIEMTMPRQFPSMAGAIILEEHLFVLFRVRL